MTALRLLLVEDEPMIRILTAKILRDAGFEVTEAWNGDEAAQILDGLERFEMLMTDVQMPGSRDGIAVMVFARSKQARIPVLVVSGYAPDLTGSLAVLEPVVFLKKPYRMAEVIRMSSQLMFAA